MNKTKFIELLRGKIDSYERWQQVCDEAGVPPNKAVFAELPPTPSVVYGSVRYVNHPTSMPPTEQWWLLRETSRMALGVYPQPSDVLQALVTHCYLTGYCIHPSKDDPAMLAYTPSMEDGKRDKQVRISFGKLMRKLLILATDEHIQKLEAMHRSEMDPTFLVARTPEEIMRVYTCMDGDSGCMRHMPSHWNLPDNMHPSMVYSYPGLAVAYTQMDGVIKSRCVIYDNPDDPSDKRWVRVYGDGALTRKLTLAGYRNDNLGGARLRLLTTGNTEYPHLVPYLDGPAGAQSIDAGSYGYIIEGEDCIRLTDAKAASRLQALGYGSARFKSQGAKHKVPVIPANKLIAKCAISGAEFNILEHDATNVYVDGEIRQAKHTAVSRLFDWRVAYVFTPTRRHLAVYTSTSTPVFYSPDHGMEFIDTPDNREICGFVRLNEARYGAGKWAYRDDAVAGANGQFYMRADCQRVIDERNILSWHPAEDVAAMRATKKYIALAPLDGKAVLSHVANPQLVRTVSGRRCAQRHHEVVMLSDGQWDYRVNTRQVRLGGVNFRIRHDTDPITCQVTEAALNQVLDLDGLHDFISEASRVDVAERRANDTFTGYVVERCSVSYFVHGGAVFRKARDGWNNAVSEVRNTAGEAGVIAAAQRIKAMTDEEIRDTWSIDEVPRARQWSTVAILLHTALQAAVDVVRKRCGPQEAAAAQANAQANAQAIDELLTATAEHIRDARIPATA